MVDEKEYDLIIIGGGPAGYSSAIYATRYSLNVLVIVKESGGLITKTHLIENYPGFPSISGIELAKKFEEHIEYYNVKKVFDEVVEIKENINEETKFEVKTLNGETYFSKGIIFATGSKRRKLNVKGEDEFQGKGVSYCATCDAMFFKNKIVCVVGGSDSAVKEALMLSDHCKKVYIIYRGNKLRAEPINQERIKKKDNIEVIYNTNIVEIKGNLVVEKIILDNKYNDSEELNVNGVFVEIGQIPQSELAKKLSIETNEKEEIIVDKFMRTNKQFVYAAGDVINFDFKQAIVSASQGSIAAWSFYEDLKKSQ